MKSGTIPPKDLSYYLEIEHIALEQIGTFLYCQGITWKIYKNPMRDDHVFVAENKEIKPYHEGSERYPAIPDTKHSYKYGLPEKFAKKLVHYLNIEMPNRIKEFEKLFKNPDYQGKIISEINK